MERATQRESSPKNFAGDKVFRSLIHVISASALVVLLFLCSVIPVVVVKASELLSPRNPSKPLPVGGNGNSVAPWMSADGRFVVFSSSASDLVTNDNGNLGLDVFLRDRQSNSTMLVSANIGGTGGGNDHSTYGMASTNGRYVVFESVASDLVPGDTNDMSDIFVRDLWTQTNILVSRSIYGNTGNGMSSEAVITPDGGYVAFVSGATNLTAGDTNGIADVFVRDLMGQQTILVSVGATANSSGSTSMSPPAITPDGHRIVFSSNARGLASGIPTVPLGEVYIRDATYAIDFADSHTNRMIWASTNALAIVTNAMNLTTAQAASSHASISDDGNYVVFKTFGTNQNPFRTAGFILRYDLTNKVTTLINANAVFPLSDRDDDVYGPQMSPDGRFVVYAGTMGNTNTIAVQLWDADTGTNIIVSADTNGNVPANTFSYTAAVSADGRFVTFLSNATNLVANVISSGFHIYLRDIQAGVTQLVDNNTNGVGATDDWGTVPVISGNGQFIAFSSFDGSLIDTDNTNAYDVFMRDTVGAATELISQRNPEMVPVAGNMLNSMGPCSISADGSRVVYSSYANDLVTNDFNNAGDVFVRDLRTGSNILVSVGMDGMAGLGGESITPAISADGRYVVFVSGATNIVANDTNAAFDVFLRDLQTGTTALVSVNLNEFSRINRDDFAPAISADGRYVAFLGYTNSIFSILWRDVIEKTTVMIAPASSIEPAIGPSISADGQRVAFFNSQSNVSVWDAQLSASIYTNATTISSAAISPDGHRLLYQTSSKQLFVQDLAVHTNILIASGVAIIKSPAQWSGDGRFFTFTSSSNLVAGDNNGANDVYLCDFQTGTLTLVSSNCNGTGSANGPSDWPTMSGDGRFVVFRSFATNVLPGVSNMPNLFAHDRYTGTTILLTTGMLRTGWTSWVSYPAISANTTMAFLSWDSGLMGGDLNRVADVFSQAIATPLVTDSDDDGIPDWWMMQYFRHPTGQAGDKSLPGDDADGDSMTNLQEYLAGTSPTDFNSVLKIQISADPAGNNMLLTWPVVTGKNYHVQYKNELHDPVWLDAEGTVTVTGSKGNFTASSDTPTRYYQVIVTQ